MWVKLVIISIKYYSISFVFALLAVSSSSLAYDTSYSLSAINYIDAPNMNNTTANSNWTHMPKKNLNTPVEYVCYRFIQQYLSGSGYNKRCDTFTGYCTQVHTPYGYQMRTRAQCRLQTEPCTGEWSQYAVFDKSSPNPPSNSIGYQFGFRKFPGASAAQAALIRCTNEPVTVRRTSY